MDINIFSRIDLVLLRKADCKIKFQVSSSFPGNKNTYSVSYSNNLVKIQRPQRHQNQYKTPLEQPSLLDLECVSLRDRSITPHFKENTIVFRDLYHSSKQIVP